MKNNEKMKRKIFVKHDQYDYSRGSRGLSRKVLPSPRDHQASYAASSGDIRNVGKYVDHWSGQTFSPLELRLAERSKKQSE